MNRTLPLIVTAAAFLTAAVPLSADEAAASPENTPMPEPRPVYVEAELPLGFPTPGPAYQVLLKEYPTYRAARADGGNAFRKLFNHIQSHDIAMTAPVEMTLTPTDAGEDEGQGQSVRDRDGFDRMDMMFMYANPDMGELGPDDTARPGEEVEVVELPPVQVLSLGFFGNADRSQINDALEMLQRHLTKREDLVAVGPARLLGYNSPMVPERNRYSEVQIPVGPAEENADASAEPEAAAPAAAQDTKTE